MAECEIDERGNEWWPKRNGKYHREDGPAVVWVGGPNEWFYNGTRHRIDGPAVVWPNGELCWCLYGRSYSFDDWLKINTYITDEEKTMLTLLWA
jgi:hypothetical protein